MTLIARPRRFGKTLNMSMLEKFFSVKYAGRNDLFENLSIWENEKYRKLQGSYPVIFLSFAALKETSFIQARKKICRIIKDLYRQFDFLLESDLMSESEKKDFTQISVDMEDNEASFSLKALSGYLFRYYGRKVLIFLDEYDTPMQEAYVDGYREELVAFVRSLFNSTFKTNPYLERAIMTGITSVSKESIFSDLNNLEVVTTTSEKYAECFGFTEKEVFGALDEFDLSSQRQQVKEWYDGFTFGKKTDIYNPWSIINFLDDRKAMNTYMNKVTSEMFSSFDTGTQPSEKEPERFYHGFVLGLMVELADKYVITSNRESGFGRYDIMLEPRAASLDATASPDATASLDATASFDAVIIEFKVQEEEEKELSDTVRDALRQIEEKNYQASLIAKGIPEDRIRKYGFVFCGKKVLIG